MGIVIGIILGICLAAGVTGFVIVKSNDLGDNKGDRLTFGSSHGAIYYSAHNSYGDTSFSSETPSRREKQQDENSKK